MRCIANNMLYSTQNNILPASMSLFCLKLHYLAMYFYSSFDKVQIIQSENKAHKKSADPELLIRNSRPSHYLYTSTNNQKPTLI